jgi:hypothetical protein
MHGLRLSLKNNCRFNFTNYGLVAIDEEDPQMESFRRNGQLMDELAEEIPDNLNELYLMYHTPA